ncbi:MAG: nucleic acid-binding protein contains domain-like protein [Prosthecobacter sp.]|nr:nucleic acid-binding protein contains domain-like protein [Prosthecobacter sp.]
MAEELRAVLDTNVLLAARRSSSPDSPNLEILSRWRRREFVFCYSLDTLAEYTEKLLAHGIPEADVEAFIHLLARHGEAVPIIFFHFRHYPVDPDDVMFLLCAINGSATHLVSYDDHLLTLQHFYATELAICEPLDFLVACRAAPTTES